MNIVKEICPICESEIGFLYTIERFDPPFHIYRCPRCGLQMQRPLPPDPDTYYNDDYYEGRGQFVYRDERKSYPYDKIVHDARLRTIAGFLPPPARFLDVGCAFGSFVKSASLFGYDSMGLDVSRYAVEHGKKTGIPIVQGGLNEEVFSQLREESFQVITMIEVMEHIADPSSAISILSRLLTPGGVLVIQTADFDGMQAKKQKENYHYYLPGHLYYYSYSNLKQILKQHGFDTFKVFRPVDFGVIPKLQKSAGSFQSPLDYMKWLKIIRYHFMGKIATGTFAMTSSMVLYAFKAR